MLGGETNVPKIRSFADDPNYDSVSLYLISLVIDNRRHVSSFVAEQCWTLQKIQQIGFMGAIKTKLSCYNEQSD